MRTRQVHFDEKNTNFLCFEYASRTGATNSKEIERMKKLMHRAINRELTERQKQCVVEHYFNEKSQRTVACELGIDESTVSRHLNAAKRKLKNIADYYI